MENENALGSDLNSVSTVREKKKKARGCCKTCNFNEVAQNHRLSGLLRRMYGKRECSWLAENQKGGTQVRDHPVRTERVCQSIAGGIREDHRRRAHPVEDSLRRPSPERERGNLPEVIPRDRRQDFGQH